MGKELFSEMEQSIINYDKDEAIRLAKMALEKGIDPAVAKKLMGIELVQIAG